MGGVADTVQVYRLTCIHGGGARQRVCSPPALLGPDLVLLSSQKRPRIVLTRGDPLKMEKEPSAPRRRLRLASGALYDDNDFSSVACPRLRAAPERERG
jgi:hypothetical protein